MKNRLVLLLLMVVPGMASADFKSDMTEEDLRRLNGEIIFSELAVGESAFLNFPFCWVASSLFVDGGATINPEPSEYALKFKVTRLPQGKASVDIAPGNRLDQSKVLESVSGILRTDRTCERRNAKEAELFPVDNISGARSSRELVTKFAQ